jgi:hypothetical protein
VEPAWAVAVGVGEWLFAIFEICYSWDLAGRSHGTPKSGRSRTSGRGCPILVGLIPWLELLPMCWSHIFLIL